MQTTIYHKILFKRENLRNILIESSNWIGDAILSTPLISIIRDIFKEGRLTILCREKLRDIFSNNEKIDEVITYEGKLDNPLELYSFSRSLRSKKFDTCIILPNSFKSALIPALAGIPYRLGYSTQLRGTLLTNSIEYQTSFKNLHQADYFFKIAGLFGSYEMGELELSTSNANRQKAAYFLKSCGIGNEEEIIVFHPGASKIEKTWHPERYVEVGKKLVEKYGYSIISLGAPNETQLIECIRRGIRKRAFSCISQEGIGIHLALIEKAVLFIGGDSGYMHAAAALGTKLVAIFGPGAPFHTHPLCDPSNYRIVNRALPCQPCNQRFFRECDPSVHGKPLCIEQISPADVMQAAETLLTST